ncbi:MAG TPA: T9SS type A sorting domain-containing protein [Edaphocola sp.]|nr:T9SS type A sorting domain-containing protein [Edaphocola sp.]
MKKRILLLTAVVGAFGYVNAQKLALIEEFSGENCPPCASSNPGFMAKINAPGNETKVLLLKYQSPIPSAGPLYLINKAFTDVRMSYYSVPFAPYARINGAVLGSGANAGNISIATQAMFDAAALESTPFSISVGNPVYNVDGQTFTSTITVTANAAATVNNAKLRVALAEELQFSTPPGTNGETHFENVVRQMYPNANGQALDAAWTSGQTRTYTVTGAMPSYVSPTAPTRFLAAFIQKDDASKEVMQSARTPGNITIQLPQADAALTGLSTGAGLKCELPASISTATTTLKNTGSGTLTSATIHYKVGTNGTWASFPWTGSIAAGQTQSVNLPTLSITTPGQVQIYDSVSSPNGKVDLNDYDNSASSVLTVLNPVAQSIPMANDLETVNSDWVSYSTPNGYPLVRASGNTANYGYNNSKFMLYYNCFNLPQSVQPGYFILPKATMPAGPKVLEFYVSYAQYEGNGQTAGDRLEVVYSTDCGTTWTRVWMQEKAELATVPNTGSSYLPTPGNNAQWQAKYADVTNVPDGAYLALRATSGYGNNMYIDNLKLRTGVAVNDLVDAKNINIFPNPIQNELNVNINMKQAGNVVFSVVNTLGQEVKSVSKDLSAGNQVINIDAAQFAAGMYILNIKTDSGNTQQKFIKK